MSQEIVGYCVTSFLINDSHLLIWINLLNDLRCWFLPPPCTTNRPVTIMISCGSENKSQQRLFTGNWLIWLTVFSVSLKMSTFLVIAYLSDFLSWMELWAFRVLSCDHYLCGKHQEANWGWRLAGFSRTVKNIWPLMLSPSLVEPSMKSVYYISMWGG